MRIIRNLSSSPATPLTMVIGNFDGMHVGHRYLLSCARAAGGTLAAMTFEPHPLALLRPQTPLFRIYGRRGKFSRLAAAGVDALYAPRFNQTLAAMTAPAFADLLFGRLRVRRLIVGENFRFGRDGAGDGELLRKAAATRGAKTEATPLREAEGHVVSSGRIRQCLRDGDFALAERLLGERWALTGKVGFGDGLGRRWGFPTANIRLPFAPPCAGVFSAKTTVDGNPHWSAVSIGVNPTVQNDNVVRVEAHLLDFNGDLYGKRITVAPVKKLRDEKRFPNVIALRQAIANDVWQTRRLADI